MTHIIPSVAPVNSHSIIAGELSKTRNKPVTSGMYCHATECCYALILGRAVGGKSLPGL